MKTISYKSHLFLLFILISIHVNSYSQCSRPPYVSMQTTLPCGQTSGTVTLIALADGPVPDWFYFYYPTGQQVISWDGEFTFDFSPTTNYVQVSAYYASIDCETSRETFSVGTIYPPGMPGFEYAVASGYRANIKLTGAVSGEMYRLYQGNDLVASNTTGIFHNTVYDPSKQFSARLYTSRCGEGPSISIGVTEMDLTVSTTASHLCNPGAVTLTATLANQRYPAYGQLIFKWYDESNQLIQTDASRTYSSQVSSTTTFYVRAYHSVTGLEGQLAAKTVGVGSPTVTITPVKSCDYDHARFVASPTSSSSTYTWYKNGQVISAETPYSLKTDVSSTGSTVISVKMTDSNGCASNTASTSTADVIYSRPLEIGHDPLCNTSDSIYLSVLAYAPGYRHIYELLYNNVYYGSEEGAYRGEFKVLPPASLEARVINLDYNCETSWTQITLSSTDASSDPVITAAADCYNGAYIKATGGGTYTLYRTDNSIGGFQYLESNETGIFTAGIDTNEPTPAFYVTRQDGGLCESSKVQVDLHPVNAPSVTASAYTAFAGDTITLTASGGQTGWNYIWRDQQFQILSTASTYKLSSDVPTEIILGVHTDAFGRCTSSPVQINVDFYPSVKHEILAHCSNKPGEANWGREKVVFRATGTIQATGRAREGYIYYWQTDPTGISTNIPVNTLADSYETLQSGTYYLRGNKKSNPFWTLASPGITVILNEQWVPYPFCQNYVKKQSIQTEGITSAGQLNATNAVTSYTYYDGLGRPMQAVAVGASPEQKDVVTPFVYDPFGREAKKYLSYEANSSGGQYRSDALSAQSAFYASPPAGITGDAAPYATTLFEPSPLSRPVGQYGAGNAWYAAGKKQTTAYRSNAANEVRLWVAGDTQVSSTGYYAAGSLYVTRTVDEDGRSVTEYTDMQGRTVRTQQAVSGTQTAATDYVYDQFFRKAYVIPPVIDKTINVTFPVTGKNFVRYIYAYRYDARGREVEKHVPGAGWTYTVYNKMDLPVLTQDADQRTRSEWSFVKYDAHGREAVSGLYVNTAQTTRAAVQGLADAATVQWETRPANGEWSSVAFPASGVTLLSVNYYDRYDFAGKENSTGVDASDLVQGMLTGSRVRVLDSSPEKWLYTTLYYDDKGRPVHLIDDNAAGGKDRVTSAYDFTGRLLATTRNHTGAGTITLTDSMMYDHAGRLTTVKQQVDGGQTVTVAANAYNATGQLAETVLHGGLETTGYAYNIRGWLTAISGQQFSEKLHYHQTVTGLKDSVQWAGNISAVEWRTPAVNADWHVQWFTYDRLNRLTNAYYRRKGEDDRAYSNKNAISLQNKYVFHTDYTTDRMGNFKWMKLWHNYDVWDNLTFGYDGNRIVHVYDLSTGMPEMGFKNNRNNSGTAYYTYDAAGRMTEDVNTGRTVAYNHLGLAKTVVQGAGTLAYTYDAAGRRLAKRLNSETPRYYMDGIESRGDTAVIHTGYGRLRRNSSAESWTRDYFLKDHLGNIRVVLEADSVSSGSSSVTCMATMEDGKAGEEEPYFANLSNTRADRPLNYPDKNPANAKLARVQGKSRGPATMLRVMAGDTIAISAKAFYNIDKALPGKGINLAPVMGTAIAAMSNPANALMGEASQLAVNLGTTASQSAALLPVAPLSEDPEEAKPESGIKFVLYNNTFDVVEENTGVLPVDDKINRIQTLASDKLVMQEAGFIEIFIDNRAQTPVYYDNLMVMHSSGSGSGSVIEVNAYYPFGMLMPGLSLIAPPDKYNAYKYSAKELETALNLGWYDFGNRIQDPVVGRFWTPDRFAEKYYHLSPYSYAANNPINYIDINGDSLGYVFDMIRSQAWKRQIDL